MLKKAIKKLLFGINHPQEYLCLGLENFSNKFNVYVSFREKSSIINVTENHIFLGYKPLVIGISVKKAEAYYKVFCTSIEVCLSFNIGLFHNNKNYVGFPVDKNSTARLQLRVVTVKDLGDTSLFILEGLKGEHKFLSSFHQFTNRLLQCFKNKGANNVGLPGNLYEQVRIAYSLPRIISIISLGKDNLYNMFPTDLHGVIDDNFYVSSLRHEGMACKQVEEIKKITLSNITTSAYRDAYDLGKNHMHDLKPIETFKVTTLFSENFHSPLHKETISYRELELADHFDIGIHRILYYNTLNFKVVQPEPYTLSHIHQYCEVWREKHGIKTEGLIR